MKLLIENWRKYLNEDTGNCFPGERTLYHGTLIDNLESIREFGLDAEIADEEGLTAFVDQFYDIPEDSFADQPHRYVYLSDKHDLDNTLTAIRFHISKKLDKYFHDITEEDIRIHGLLVIAKCVDTEDSYMDPADEDEFSSRPHGVEPGDYYFEAISGDIFLTGKKLVRFFRRKGLIPWKNPFGGKTQ